jgi:hypothetical protein
MAKLNTRTVRSRTGASPVQTTDVATTTYEGGAGFLRDEKSELFLLAVGRFHGEDTFYESADEGTQRFRRLVRSISPTDPVWMGRFLAWLRGPEANIRTAAIVGAVEYARSMLDLLHMDKERPADAPTIRSVIGSVLQRADEPAELLSYWISEYGRTIPSAVKRGVGDAVIRLGTEYAYAKYDSSARGVRYADVLNLVHPGDRKGSRQVLKGYQHDLFELATSSPYRDVEPGESLTLLRAREALMAVPVAQRRDVVLGEPQRLADAGITWEALAGWLQGPMDARAWESVIPSMGVMALIRNLRNFDEAGISREAVAKVVAKISDPEVVARSRQLPFRWLAAYNAVTSDRYRVALGDALELSTRNIPDFAGRTLVLVDCSASMGHTMSGRSQMAMADAAGLFGTALASRLPGRVDLVSYGSTSRSHPLARGGSVLAHAKTFIREGGHVGHGTNTWEAVERHFDGHDRVMIFTDGQTWDSPSTRAAKARIYTWNLAGYSASMGRSSANFQEVGGLSDATFKLLPLMERGRDAKFPWED